MDHSIRWRQEMRAEVERLLQGLGTTPGAVATALRDAGVPLSIPLGANDRRSALERFVAAVVGADPDVASVGTSPRTVTIRSTSRWRRPVTVDIPEPARRFAAGPVWRSTGRPGAPVPESETGDPQS